MKVIKMDTMQDGTEIMLCETIYGITIKAYPLAKNSSAWIRVGETFTLTIAENRCMNYVGSDVKSDYQKLVNGTKQLADLSDHFHNGRKDMWYLGIVSKRPGSVYMREL